MLLQEKVRLVLEAKGRDVYTISAGASVADAVQEMNKRGVGALVVVEGNRPVGIFTERDVLRRLPGESSEWRSVKVASLMTQKIIVIDENVSIGEAMAIITEKRCRHLPVVEQGRLTGIVSSGDLTKWVTKKQRIHIDDLTSFIMGTYPV
jgi:CBS domain-containing protein